CVGLDHRAGAISVTSVVAITSAPVVYQLAQPRIRMTLSRDGLLRQECARVHPKYQPPSFAPIVTGIVVAVPSLFFKMDFFIDLTSVGTFFAFILGCAGVLYMDHTGLSEKSKFRVPYINGKYLVGLGFVVAWILVYQYGQDAL